MLLAKAVLPFLFVTILAFVGDDYYRTEKGLLHWLSDYYSLPGVSSLEELMNTLAVLEEAQA